MTNRPGGGILHVLRSACAPHAEGDTDGQLLALFLSRRDESAFATLVRRHGPMVLAVCRRVLGNEADAEDAFQATFLVLARKASSLKAQGVVGGWLHGVARRTALNARRAAARRRVKEQSAARPEVQGDDVCDDRLPLLDEELSRLAEKYRLPIVLCDMEGRTRGEVARQLGWPEGTVASRITRGRALLVKRLARRGLVVSAGLAASACVPWALAASTTKIAAGLTADVIPAPVAELARGVIQGMLLNKLKTVMAVAMVGLGTVALGYGVLAGGSPADKADPPEKPMSKPAEKEEPDPKQLADLAERLRSRDHQERSAALATLAKLLTPEAKQRVDFGPVVAPLFDLSGWGGEAMKNAESAERLLVRIGPRAVPLLRKRLDSDDAHDRRVAAELLVRVGPANPALASLLRPLLTDKDDYVRLAAINGLGTLGSHAEDAIADLERVGEKDPIQARRVAARVALIRVAGASPERVGALAAFMDMKEPDHEAAAYATSALGDLGPQARSAEPQLRAALKHKEAGVRVNAAAALGRVGASSPDTITALVGLLKNDPEREVRRSTAGALSAIGPAAREAIPALANALVGDGKGGWWVAADAIARIGGADAVPPLIEALKNVDDDVRLTAIRGLGKLGAVAKPAVEALEKASRDDANSTNRAAAAEAVRKIGH